MILTHSATIARRVQNSVQVHEALELHTVLSSVRDCWQAPGSREIERCTHRDLHDPSWLSSPQLLSSDDNEYQKGRADDNRSVARFVQRKTPSPSRFGATPASIEGIHHGGGIILL